MENYVFTTRNGQVPRSMPLISILLKLKSVEARFTLKLLNADAPVQVPGQQVLNIQMRIQSFQYSFNLITENMET